MLIDAICQITGTTEEYTSPIPEPFTFIPENQRSIELADGSIGSSFLEMFGRSPRDTGLESERNNRPTAAQRTAPAQFEPYPPQNRAERQAAGAAAIEAQAARDHRRVVLDDSFAFSDGRGIEDPSQEYAEPGHEGRRPMMDLVWALFNSSGVSLPALRHFGVARRR